MLQNRYLVVFAVILYIFLIVIYEKHHHKSKLESECLGNKPCVRFCCKDETYCNQNFINAYFNVSSHYVENNSEESDEEEQKYSTPTGVIAIFSKLKCYVKSGGFDWKMKSVSWRGTFKHHVCEKFL